MRYRLTPVRMAFIKKRKNSKYQQGGVEKVILVHCLWRYKLMHYENIMEVPQKLKIRVTIWSSNWTTGYFSKKIKILIQKDILTPMFLTQVPLSGKARSQMQNHLNSSLVLFQQSQQQFPLVQDSNLLSYNVTSKSPYSMSPPEPTWFIYLSKDQGQYCLKIQLHPLKSSSSSFSSMCCLLGLWM